MELAPQWARAPRLCVRSLVALGAFAVPLLACAASSFAGTWQSPVELSATGHEGRSPAIALNAAGDAVAVWLNRYGSNWNIDAASLESGGSWQEPLAIETPAHIGFHPDVAIDPHGDAVAVWRDGETETVDAAVRPSGGEWQAPVEVSAPGENEKPVVAVDGAGRAIVAWEREEDGESVIQAAVGSLADSVWDAPTVLSPSGQDSANPQVAIDAEGQAQVVWQSYLDGDYAIEAAAGLTGRDSWRAPVEVASFASSAGQVDANPQVAINEDGEAVAAWESGGYELTPYAVQAALLTGGEWHAPSTLSEAGGPSASFPSVAISFGGAVVAWENRGSGAPPIQSASRPLDGAWQAPIALVASGSSYSPDVAMDAEGEALAVWDDAGHSIKAGTLAFEGEEWLAPSTISASAGVAAPRLAVNRAGSAVAAWEGTGETGEEAEESPREAAIYAASYDPEAPMGGGEETLLRRAAAPAPSPAPTGLGPAPVAAAAPSPDGTAPASLAKPTSGVRARPSQCASVKRSSRQARHGRRAGTRGCAAATRRAGRHGERRHAQ